MKKIIAVTGGAGFIGSNLINYLIKKLSLKLYLSIIIPPVEKRITLKVAELSI